MNIIVFVIIFTVQASPENYGTELLRRYHENLSEIFTDNQMLLKMIPNMKRLAPGEREVRGRKKGGLTLRDVFCLAPKVLQRDEASAGCLQH